MASRHYKITDGDGRYVCSRGTKAECQKIVKAYASDPVSFKGWDNPPYYVTRVEETLVWTYRRTTSAKP